MNWHLLTTEKIFELFSTSHSGLSAAAAERLLGEHGPNEIIEQKRVTVGKLLLRQFTDFMILILFAAAILSGILGEWTDTVIILLIVLLNGAVGFIQEYRAEKAMAALKKMAATNAMVIRDHAASMIPSSQLVPGDLVSIEAGNIIPADMRLIEVHRLKVNESSLTGESYPVDKISHAVKTADIPLGDRKNMVYRGTFATYGRAKGIVVATGMATEIGKIAGMLQEGDTQTPLQRRLASFGKKLTYIIVAICFIILLLGILRGEDLWRLLLTAVSLAVAAIPEALPAVIAIALALGARRMVRHHALIRRLPAVETLGSITYICSDKTGTLTENRMTVERVFDGKKTHHPVMEKSVVHSETNRLLLTAMALNNDVVRQQDGTLLGDSTEIAPFEFAAAKQFVREELEKQFPRRAEIPFDAVRKRMTTLHASDGQSIVFVKGALDLILENTAGLSTEDKLVWQQQADSMASEGLRVLAYAVRNVSHFDEPLVPESIERDLSLIGLVGISDPPREAVKQSVEECRAAGIIPVIVTGDYLLTAKAIARRLGILDDGESEMITGSQLDTLSDDEFIKRMEHIRVYARVSPEQKLRIIKALQHLGHSVAMTGDGVNDAPSLKRADIGVAMGITGTDVAKESSDMILLDDNFTSIVKAIREGRRIYDNIRKFVRYILSGNTGEIWTITLAPLLGLPLPLLPIHILWINLVSDGLPAIALAAEPEDAGIMQRPPRPANEGILARGLGIHVLWVGLLMGLICVGAQWLFIRQEGMHWQTMIFSILALSQMAHVMAIRSETRSLFSIGIFSNLPLLGAVLLTVLLQLALIYIPFLNPIFNTAPLSLSELAVTFGLPLIIFFAVEAEKFLLRRK